MKRGEMHSPALYGLSIWSFYRRDVQAASVRLYSKLILQSPLYVVRSISNQGSLNVALPLSCVFYWKRGGRKGVLILFSHMIHLVFISFKIYPCQSNPRSISEDFVFPVHSIAPRLSKYPYCKCLCYTSCYFQFLDIPRPWTLPYKIAVPS